MNEQNHKSDSKRTGSTSMTAVCGKDCPAQLRLDELIFRYVALVAYADKVSLTDALCLSAALDGLGHAELAGLALAFMGVATSTSMVGD